MTFTYHWIQRKHCLLSLSSAFVTDAILAIWQLPQSDCGRLW